MPPPNNPSGQAPWRFCEAKTITPAERDSQLQLAAAAWPVKRCPGWTLDSDGEYMHRQIESCACKKECPRPDEHQDKALATPLQELVLRFPSAPIRGIQRLNEYHNNPLAPEALHTYRVLIAGDRPPKKISRIYVFHNGLNELDKMGLYYQLASQIIAAHEKERASKDERAAREDKAARDRDTARDDGTTCEEGVACVLRPFPGHLTRAAYAQFAEEPLHRYLWDGSHLFCQFLRYMIETQWFLSSVVKRSRYRSPSGAELLLEGEEPAGSRLETEGLAEEMEKQWEALHVASGNRSDHGERTPGRALFRRSIASLRDVLRLEEWPKLGGELTNGGYDEEPSLHMVGYSLGGFTAQSVFMSWPFVVSSCSTLLSGGALRELSPTAFAHCEEWQTVLHSLRYELDEGMLDRRYKANAKKVAGLDRELFHHCQRTFYEVFEQEYRGSYESRVEAFRQRMLFVVGGNDPIVRPDSVLDSAPAGGMNVLEIGGLGHFLDKGPRDHDERQPQEFWLPEVGALIGRFSADAAKRHSEVREDVWLDHSLEVKKAPDSSPANIGVQRMSDRERLDLAGDGALVSRQFGVLLNDLVARQVSERRERGVLLVLRNEIPTLLLPPRAIQRRGRALYHHDEGIVEYCREVQARSEEFEKMCQTILVLPWNARKIMERLDPPHRFPSQSETAVGQIADEIMVEETWNQCQKTLKDLNNKSRGSVRIYDGRSALDVERLRENARRLLHFQQKKDGGVLHVPSLPDCWLWLDANFLGFGDHEDISVKQALDAVAKKALRYQTDKQELAAQLREERVRAVTVSRARYNPRFRGRLVVNPRAVQQVLLHAGICLAASCEYRSFDLDTEERTRERR
jgi:hypothetical protein